MAKISNRLIIEAVKEITVAKLGCSDQYANLESGKATAEFMQEIYDKLISLSKPDDD